jgi:flagellar L-ring protein precursor FlgH
MKRLAICLTCTFVMAAAPLAADSLWAKAEATKGQPATSIVTDIKAHNVGDLVTVLVIESTTSTQAAATDLKKDLKHNNGAGVGPFLSLVPALGITSGQSSSSAGQKTMSNNLATRLTATVTKVLPNGNLEINGQRALQTNGEKQTMTITATVRPQDVAQDNTVYSTSLANVQVDYTGKGAIGDREHEGLLSRLLKFIF